MENKDYYSITGHISSSSLKLFQKSIHKFKRFIDGTLEEKKEEYLIVGTLIHMYLLERERFNKEIKVYDYTSPNSQQKKDFCTYLINKKITNKSLLNAYDKAYTNSLSESKKLEKATELYTENLSYIKVLNEKGNKTYISTDFLQKLKKIETSIIEHKKAKDLIFPINNTIIDNGIYTFSEKEFIWENEGLNFKAMLDRVIVNEHTKTITIVDVKTTTNIDNFTEDFKKYDYGIQLAFYKKAILEVGDKFLNLQYALPEYNIDTVIVAIDKITTVTKTFKFPLLHFESNQIEYMLEDIKWHFENDKWEHSRQYYEGDGYEIFY